MLTPTDIKNGWIAWDPVAARQRPDPYALPDDLDPDDRVQLRLSDGTKLLLSMRAERARWATSSRPGPVVVAYRRCTDFTEEGTTP
jgi:hypothetical protein